MARKPVIPTTKDEAMQALANVQASHRADLEHEFPRRWAISASMLSKTLRALARHERDPVRAAEMVDRAEALVRQAIEHAEE